MRYLFLYLSALLLFSGCEIAFKSRTDKLKEEKAYATASACNENEKEAQRLSLAALSKATNIDSVSVLKKSRVQLVQQKQRYCYEAILTYEGWAQYRQELQQERDAIFDRMQKFNNTVLYSDKAAAVAKLLQDKKAFNRKIDRADKIAPTMIGKIDIEKSTIEQSINALPSLNFEINDCEKQGNHRCQVGFISNVRDESKKVTYYWDFGDGESSGRKNPLHTYHRFGDYRVTLQVTDEKGAKNSVSKTIHPVPKIKPTVLFRVKKKQYTLGENIYFDNSSYSKGGKLKRNRWEFGDGAESSLRNPSHRYKSTGVYTVKLKVCDSDGVCDTASNSIKVTQMPVTNAVKGEEIQTYIAKNGRPAEHLIKKNASIKAYRYGDIWLLVKWGRIECAVLDGGLGMTLMGYPKQCHWHEKHAADYMIDLK